jgi:hypothetical protein
MRLHPSLPHPRQIYLFNPLMSGAHTTTATKPRGKSSGLDIAVTSFMDILLLCECTGSRSRLCRIVPRFSRHNEDCPACNSAAQERLEQIGAGETMTMQGKPCSYPIASPANASPSMNRASKSKPAPVRTNHLKPVLQGSRRECHHSRAWVCRNDCFCFCRSARQQ